MKPQEIKKKAFTLWEDYADEKNDLKTPLVYPALKKNSLLFIGLNPSFSKRGYKKIQELLDLENFDPLKFYNWKNKDSFNLDTAISIEKAFKEHYSYFDKIKKVATKVESQWEHIDLFFSRKTNQKEFLKTVTNKGEFNDFGKKQLDLSSEIISAINPKLITVINAAAAKIFEKYYDAVYDETLGYHTVNLKGTTIPVILTSMLSGQRALDNYSFQRLTWHTNYVLEDFYGKS